MLCMRNYSKRLNNMKDYQSKRNLFQNYNGEPTLLGLFCGAVVIGLIISLIYLT